MSTHDTTKYSVNSRISALQNAVTELQKENKELRAHLGAQLANLVKDATSTIQASLRIPQDGAPGKDGRNGVDGQSVVGPRGTAGDVLILNESELAAAVIALRRKLLEQRAQFVGRIQQSIADNSTDSKVQQHYAKLLQYILRDIEKLA